MWKDSVSKCVYIFSGKNFETESCYFIVLNKIYLQNFLYGWIVNREMNLMSLTSSWLADGYCSIILQIMD